MDTEIIDTLTIQGNSKIVFLIMDGLGGTPNASGLTELEMANTPNLDALVKNSICGLLNPVGYGITPGSGPAHFALFGYDPIKNYIGRGMLEAAGIDYQMTAKDLFIRVNFASMDKNRMITDRRAGRIDTETNARICAKLQQSIQLPSAKGEFFFAPVRDHRALLVLRGNNLSDSITETDPQKVGMAPLAPSALTADAVTTAEILAEILAQAKTILADETKANIPLLRGYARYRKFPSMQERYKLKSLAVASYPMYRGIARLLGMDIAAETKTVEDEFSIFEKEYVNYDFFFVHIKETDSRGEDGNFAAKVSAIEKIDSIIPKLTALNPNVLVVTGDHSTPAGLSGHSWHPVPVLLAAKNCRPDFVSSFGERACIAGGIGIMPMQNLMGLVLANAGRLEKFGA